MAQDKKSFTHLSLQDSESIQQVLKAITESLSKGSKVFSDEEGEITLNPCGLIRLKVSATKTDTRNRLNIKLSWEENEENLNKRKIVNVSSKKKKSIKKQ